MGTLLLWLARNPGIRQRVFRALQDGPELFARMLEAHVGKASSADLLSAGASLGRQLLAW